MDGFLGAAIYRGVVMESSDYIESATEFRRERLLVLMQLIKQLYPDAQESMQYKMPTYTSANGWVAVANQKSYVSLYTCAAKHLVSFKAAHPKIKTGTGCINFRDKDSIPLSDLELVIHSAMRSSH